MKKSIILLLSFASVIHTVAQPEAEGQHLFILSGQSNMARLKPEQSFLPEVAAAFGESKVIVVKDAMGTQPIRRWYKDWKPLAGGEPKADGALYDSLMKKVAAAVKHKMITTITFIWMQGERDAREKLGEVYERSLTGLYQQLSNDLGRNDVNFIIGRLNDYDMMNEKYPHWVMIRNIQVKVGESDARFRWVNTDDLNDLFDKRLRKNTDDLHMTDDGYVKLGKRFALEAIELIRNGQK